MLYSIYTEPVKTNRIAKLDNDLYIFKENISTPFAFRTANNNNFTPPTFDGSLIVEIGAFSIYAKLGEIYCIYSGIPKITARILPITNVGLDISIVQKLEKYFKKAYTLDPYEITARSAFENFGKLVEDAADFCGCLTDVISDDVTDNTYEYHISFKNIKCEQIALALPIISLMYRRISALRGFNFKITVKEHLPCLIFSAKVIFPREETPREACNVLEYSELSQILNGNGLITGVKLKPIDDETELYRLSIAICPQEFDPRGILRAPVWKKQVKDIIDSLDLDLDCKY